MASGSITSWQIGGETVTDFILGGSKITADGDCSHETKRGLFLERKAMTHLDSIFKSRDIILPTKVHLVKAMICLLRNLCAGQEATVRTGHGTTDWVPNRKRSSSRLYMVTLLI